MDQKAIFEQLGGTYSQQGDYLLLNLTLPDTKEYVIGKYGHMRKGISKSTARFSTQICLPLASYPKI